MQYKTDEWREAKEAFLTAVKAAIEAKKVAFDCIQSSCGQEMDVGEIVGEGEGFFTSEPDSPTRFVYNRAAFLAEKAEPLRPEGHWEITLPGLRHEIAALKPMASPEWWEAAWAKAQEGPVD